MLRKLARRKARIDGRLDEHLAEEEAMREEGMLRKVFGKIGSDDDQLDDGIARTSLGGAWSLKDLDGNKLGSTELAGNYYLLFFGGTLCPDITPLTLMKIMKAVRKLKRSSEGKQYIKPIPVFVSTNPEKDTPNDLKKYRDSLFGKDLLIARTDSSDDKNFLEMLKKFKVPVG